MGMDILYANVELNVCELVSNNCSLKELLRAVDLGR